MKRMRALQAKLILLACVCFGAVGMRNSFCVTLAIPQVKIENPQSGYAIKGMGNSIAIDNDTMIAGAPYTSRPGLLEAGVARVYVSDHQGGWAMQAELKPTTPTAQTHFGKSVAISGDTAVITAYSDDSSGSVYVFVRNGSVWTEQAKIVKPNVYTFGNAVSISGATIVVGAGTYNTLSSVYVYTRDGGNWIEQAQLSPSDAELESHFGECVSISGDTVVVGASWSDNGVMGSDQGSVYVFTRSDSRWTQEAKIIPSEHVGFGICLSLSGDTVVVGAEGGGGYGGKGSAYIYRRNNGAWIEQAKLINPNASFYSAFGNSVAVSGDIAVIGEFGNDDLVNPNSGAAFVYARNGSSWTQQAKLTASDASADDDFGYSVALSGNSAVVGANGNDDIVNDSGSVYAFGRNGSDWSQQAKLTGGITNIAEGDLFGYSVAISGDTAIIGLVSDDANGKSNSGSAYIFVQRDGAWIPQAHLIASDAASGNCFGWSAAISNDTAVIGASYCYESDTTGSAYVFTRSGDVWTQQAKLRPSDSHIGDCFGASVSISGNTVIVGSDYYDKMHQTPGAAYVFTRADGIWTQQAKLAAPGITQANLFGYSVSVSGDMAMVGSITEKRSFGTGFVYIYTRQGSSWVQQTKISPSDQTDADYFGGAVSFSGDTAIIGAYMADGIEQNAGSAYIFTRANGTWSQQAKLFPNDKGSSMFGWSASIIGDIAVVGAVWGDSAYVFQRNGTTWAQQAKLTAVDGTKESHFGAAVAIDGQRVIVGASGEDDSETSSGAAYAFDLRILSNPSHANRAWELYK